MLIAERMFYYTVIVFVPPRLQELHLSINDYGQVALNHSFLHAGLKHLHLNDNKIKEWEEMVKLSAAFPSLQKLIASNNPVRYIPPDMDSNIFPQLLILNLNNSDLSSWDSIENLHALSMLRELSVLKIPLGRQMEEKIRRQAFIARLPNIQKLNKSDVTENEREMSERWLIRELKDSHDHSALYHNLVKKHGELNPLVDINLTPVDKVTLDFHFDGLEREVEQMEVNIFQTVYDFKKWVSESLVDKPVNRFRLWFYDKSLADCRMGEMLRYNKKMLYTYRMNDGDEIHVQMK